MRLFLAWLALMCAVILLMELGVHLVVHKMASDLSVDIDQDIKKNVDRIAGEIQDGGYDDLFIRVTDDVFADAGWVTDPAWGHICFNRGKTGRVWMDKKGAEDVKGKTWDCDAGWVKLTLTVDAGEFDTPAAKRFFEDKFFSDADQVKLHGDHMAYGWCRLSDGGTAPCARVGSRPIITDDDEYDAGWIVAGSDLLPNLADAGLLSGGFVTDAGWPLYSSYIQSAPIRSLYFQSQPQTMVQIDEWPTQKITVWDLDHNREAFHVTRAGKMIFKEPPDQAARAFSDALEKLWPQIQPPVYQCHTDGRGYCAIHDLVDPDGIGWCTCTNDQIDVCNFRIILPALEAEIWCRTPHATATVFVPFRSSHRLLAP